MTIEEEIIKDIKDLKELQSSDDKRSDVSVKPAEVEDDKTKTKESYEERTHDTWEKNPRNNETKTQYEEAEIIVEESE